MTPARFGLAVTLLLAVACNRQAILDPNTDYVVGDWEWSWSCCSVAGQVKTPGSENYSYVLQYSSDGTVRAFRNNALIQTTRFTVQAPDPSLLASQVYVITYDEPLQHGPGIPAAKTQNAHKSENGTLTLIVQGCADCYSEWTFLPRLTSP
jgi:hypothetical protein